jgi:predicted CXXCH cytochrome family protein
MHVHARRNRLFVLLLLLTAAGTVHAVEHPGVVPKESECSSCHASKMTGASVHSAMASSCNVCHLAKTQGDMTVLNLIMPKTQICFACHEKSAALQQHSPIVKGRCLDCHDAHSSDRRMLLRAEADGPAVRP